jgi:hypothetical protein
MDGERGVFVPLILALNLEALTGTQLLWRGRKYGFIERNQDGTWDFSAAFRERKKPLLEWRGAMITGSSKWTPEQLETDLKLERRLRSRR